MTLLQKLSLTCETGMTVNVHPLHTLCTYFIWLFCLFGVLLLYMLFQVEFYKIRQDKIRFIVFKNIHFTTITIIHTEDKWELKTIIGLYTPAIIYIYENL